MFLFKQFSLKPFLGVARRYLWLVKSIKIISRLYTTFLWMDFLIVWTCFYPSHFSYILGDKSILQDAGLGGMKDVEALPPPPEIKDKVPSQKYRGDVSYFICTKPGRGPVLLSDECQALLDPKTGLPKWFLKKLFSSALILFLPKCFS